MTWCRRDLVVMSGHLGFAKTEAEFHRKLRYLKVPMRTWPEFVSGHATTHFFERDDRVCAIVCYRVDKTRTAAQVASLMAHEAVHVWRSAVKQIGEKEPSEEFEAYGIQNITQELLTALWGKQK